MLNIQTIENASTVFKKCFFSMTKKIELFYQEITYIIHEAENFRR